jgi:ribosome maturation factor RimP
MHQPSSFDRSARSPDAGEAAISTRSVGAVRAALEPLALARGVSLVDVAWTTEHGARTLRVTIERPSAAPPTAGFGVTVDDCAEFSRDASSVLDVLEGLDHAYCLEVSSPGLERPLRSLSDFKRFSGQLAKVKLTKPAGDGQRLLRGLIEDVSGADDASAEVSMRVDGKLHRVAFTAIASAQLTFDMPGQQKPSLAKKSPAKKGRASKGGASPR